MIWTLANAFTMLRVVLLPLLLFLLQKESFLTGFIILSIMGISDVLDGRIARLTKTASRLGAAFDVIADCLTVFALQLFLVLKGAWPAYLPLLSAAAVLSFCLRQVFKGGGNKPRLGKYTGAVLMASFIVKMFCGALRAGIWERIDGIIYPAIGLYLSLVIAENIAGMRFAVKVVRKIRFRFRQRVPKRNMRVTPQTRHSSYQDPDRNPCPC